MFLFHIDVSHSLSLSKKQCKKKKERERGGERERSEVSFPSLNPGCSATCFDWHSAAESQSPPAEIRSPGGEMRDKGGERTYPAPSRSRHAVRCQTC